MGCRRFLEGSHGDRIHVDNDEPGHRALHHYAGLNSRGEFREDVVTVARRRESGVTIKQIATDFGISEATLQNWLRQADVEEGNRPGQTAVDAAEVWELCRRNRLLVQGNEVLGKAGA